MTPERMRRIQIGFARHIMEIRDDTSDRKRLADVQDVRRSDLSFLNEHRVDKYLRSARPVAEIEGWTHIGAVVRNIMAEIE